MSQPVKNYHELKVWQAAMDLAVACYKVTACFPREEKYGLTSQIRRAASSIAANIAEGQGRHTTADYIRFLAIAYGSLMELETHLRLAARLTYLDGVCELRLLRSSAEIGRMLNGLTNALRTRQSDSDP
jgi:four helix bundle protein